MNKPAGTAWKLKTARLQMQTHRETTLNSRITHIAAAFILAAVLGSCGGGGGGGGGSPGAMPDVSYPTLSNAIINSANGGVTSNYSLAGASPGIKLTLQPQPSSVTVSLNAPAQSLTINVTGITGLAPPGEPPFSITVPNPGLLGLLANSPLNGCPNCLRAGSVAASDGKPVSFIYLDPSSAAALTYSTLGLWSKPSSAGGPDVGAAFSIGVVTRPQDLPIFGSATYNGFMVGRYTDGLNTYAVGANVTAVVTFTLSGTNPASSVTFSTTNTYIALEGSLVAPILQPLLNLSGNLTYSSGSNSLTTSALTTTTGLGIVSLTGPATAKYYGPPIAVGATPAEFGGAFFVGNGSQQMNGSFALKKL